MKRATTMATACGTSAGGIVRVALWVALLTATAATASVPEPDGYRLDNYDALVPDGLTGATTVAGPDVLKLQRERQAVVVDVIPQHRRPRDLADDELWFPVAHQGVAGALWLPDTGFGELAPVTERYLFGHLESATNDNPDHPVVFYCRIDCWMSWNTAKRTLNAGYSNVYWYRDGIEDWLFEDFAVEILEPAPGARLPGDE